MWRNGIEVGTVDKVVAINRIISTLSITAMSQQKTPSIPSRSRLRPRTIIGILIAAGAALTVVGCVRQSGKVVYFHEAELPHATNDRHRATHSDQDANDCARTQSGALGN